MQFHPVVSRCKYVASIMFRCSTASSGDMSFFGASFETSNTRTYDFAYYNVNVSESAVPISERKYGYLTTTMTWLNCECACEGVWV